MTLSSERDVSSLSSVIQYALEQWTKSLHTSVPGNVLRYDAITRRATIQPGMCLLMTDGTLMSRAPIPNVPVLIPWVGSGGLILNPEPGDPVMLIFSERGLTEWKKSYLESSPDPDSLLSERDAIAVPGFGDLTNTPVTTTGVALQNSAGTAFIRIEGGQVAISTNGNITMRGSAVTITGSVNVSGSLSVNGAAVRTV